MNSSLFVLLAAVGAVGIAATVVLEVVTARKAARRKARVEAIARALAARMPKGGR